GCLGIARGALIVGYAHRAVGLESFEAPAVRFGLAGLRLRRGKLLLRRFHRELVIGVVESREHVAAPHLLADVDLPCHHLAADAEALVDFVARLYGPEVAVRLLEGVIAHLHGPNLAKGFGRRLVLPACGERCRDGGGEKYAGKSSFHEGFLVSMEEFWVGS